MPIWQLCANLLIPNCLRSNLSYSPLAALELYVNETITEELRNIVRQCARDMHDIFSKAVIPKAGYGKHCDKCSLKDICMPEMVNNCTSVDNYLTKNLYL